MNDSSAFWTPDTPGRNWRPDEPGDTLENVTKAYSVYLEVCAPDQHTAFLSRLVSDPEAAKAEAAIFSWLRARRLAPRINEKIGQGGIDYLCSASNGIPFLIEVTSLSKAAVVNKSGLPDSLDEVARCFCMITPQLAGKGQSKAQQLATGPIGIPSVLTICLAHPGASALLSTLAAEWLMLSDPTIQVLLRQEGKELGPARLATDLKRSVFFGPRDGVIVPMRESISAILLVALWDRQLDVLGLLHPKPTVPLDYRAFTGVPFLRVEWPITSPANMEWVIGDPSPLTDHHVAVALSGDELKGK
jgi:hypothetical protein